MILNGGTVSFATLTNPSTANVSAGSIEGPSGLIELGSASIAVGYLNSDTVFGGVISGTGGLIKAGSGTMTLGGNNTYTGGTLLGAGELILSNNAALGTGELKVEGGLGNGLGYASDVTIANTITLGIPVTLTTEGTATQSGAIRGDAGIIKAGAGNLILSGTNTYKGTTTVSAGTLTLAGHNSLPSNGAVDVAAGATLHLSGQAIGSLSGAGHVVSSGTLNIGQNNSSSTFSGSISGSTISKYGTGTLMLSGQTITPTPFNLYGGTLVLGSEQAVGRSGIIFYSGNGTQTLQLNEAALGDPGGTFAAPLVQFGTRHTLDLRGLPYAPGATAVLNGDILTVTSSGISESFILGGNLPSSQFRAVDDGAGGVAVRYNVGTPTVVVGDRFANDLTGTVTDDEVRGLGGRDKLWGLSGDDVIVGGRHKDMLFGGRDADQFVFDSFRHSPRGVERDVIGDFESGIDVIDLGGIDADPRGASGNQAFMWVDERNLDAKFTGQAGELRFVNQRLVGDVDGDGRGDFVIKVIGSLVAADVLL